MWHKVVILWGGVWFVWSLSLYGSKDVSHEVNRVALKETIIRAIEQPSIAKNATNVERLSVSKQFVRSKAETVIFGPEDFSTWLPEGWDTIINNTEWTGTYPCTWGQFTDYYHSEPACAGLWWSYSNQDEWLISPEIPLTGAASGIYVLRFWTYGYEGSTYGDHYWVEISTDHGATWTPVFDLADLPGNAWNEWDYPYEIDLSEYAGDTIMFAFHAWAEGGLWYAWMVDDPEIFYLSDYDVGVVAINSPARYVRPGVTFTPSVTVQNFGAATVTFDVGFEIYDAEDNQIYSSTATVTNLECDETQEVTFAPNWTPPAEGSYTAVAYTMLVEDENTANDTMVVAFEVTAMWVDTLFYDDGTVANAGAWYYAGNGFGYKFTPGGGQYPIQVNGVLLYFYDGWPDPGGDQFRVMICDDDGPNGAPGTKVYISPVISGATTGAWNYVDLSSQYIVFEDGSFYVFYIQVGDYPYCLGLCADGAINTLYGCAWEYYADGDSFAIDDLSWIGGDWLLRAEITPYSPPTIDVWLPDTSGAHGDTVLLPVMASDLTGYGVYSVGMDITFDTNVVVAMDVSNSGCVTEGWGPPTYNIADGHVIIGMAGVTPLAGSGPLTYIKFYVSGSPGDMTTLHFDEFMFNEGSPSANTTDGTFTVTGVPDIDLPDTLYDLGAVSVGDTLFCSICVRNVGDAILQIDSVTSSAPQLFEISNFNTLIAPQDSGTIEIRFIPTVVDTGSQEGIISIYSNDPDESIAIVRLIAYVVGVKEITLPKCYALKPNIPNPFTHHTVIEYQLPKKTHVTIKVYNLTGELITTLVDDVYEPGHYTVKWDGCDDEGNVLPAGVYFYIMQTTDWYNLRKAIIVR